MTDLKALLERADRAVADVPLPPDGLDGLQHRRDRKRRNQRITAGVVGIAVFLAAIWIVTSGGTRGTQTPAVPGDSSAVQPSPPVSAVGPVPETDYILDLNTGEMTPLPESIVSTKDLTGGYAVSRDGSKLAYVAPGDNGNPRIFVANLDGTRIEQVTVEVRGEAMPSAEAMPAWSPEGSRIAYIGSRDRGAPGNVYILDLATGVSTQVTDDPQEGANAPSFSPDGSSIVYGAHRRDSGDQVLIVPVAGGASAPLLGGDGASASLPALSPDGSLMSYDCGEKGQSFWDLCLANADGTDARVLVVSGEPRGSWSPDGTRIAYWDGGGPLLSDVYVVDVATGETTRVAGGARPVWLDDHTLIVDHDYCNRPSDSCGF